MDNMYEIKIRNILNACLVDKSDIKVTSKPSDEPENSAKDGTDQDEELPPLVTHKDRKEYEARVATFTVQFWSLKPAEISPRHCARYGWKCIAKDRLRCILCDAYITGLLPSITKVKTYNECFKLLKNQLKTGHEIGCPWSMMPCPSEFESVEFARSESLCTEFVETVNALQCMGDVLPDTPMLASEGDYQELLKIINKPNGTDTSNQIAITLAIGGWRKANTNTPALYCSHCHRTVGCGGFQKSDSGAKDREANDEDNNVESEEVRCGKRKLDDSESSQGMPSSKISKREPFNPLNQHWHWCPWANETGKGAKKQQTWEKYVLFLITQHAKQAKKWVNADPSDPYCGMKSIFADLFG